MRGHRLTGPQGAHFPCCAIADRKDEIKWRGTRSGELVPVLAPQPFSRKVIPRHCLERQRMHGAPGVTSGAECTESAFAEMIQQHFRHDAAGGVASAEKQHVEGAVSLHWYQFILAR